MKVNSVHWLGLVGLSLSAVCACASAENLTRGDAAAYLQRMSDAARQLPYEGVFVMTQGDRAQTVRVMSRLSGPVKESRLMVLDGQEREVRCSRSNSISLVGSGAGMRMERRLGSRHFPDLLPDNAAALAEWYDVRLGNMERVGGFECRQVDLVPKDAYRWGYVLCADKNTAFPLRAVMVNAAGKPLMQYRFAELKLGAPVRMQPPPAVPAQTDGVRAVDEAEMNDSPVQVNQLPPGFVRVAGMRRHIPNHASVVQHWVFSDGLTHVSMFLEPSSKPIAPVKGESPLGMMNLLKRQVGGYEVTIVGDAPWPTVESIAMQVGTRAAK